MTGPACSPFGFRSPAPPKQPYSNSWVGRKMSSFAALFQQGVKKWIIEQVTPKLGR